MPRLGKLTMRGADWRAVGPLEFVPPVGVPTREDWAEAFGRDAETVVEIGPGKGDFLAELARRHPERNLVGLEIKRARAVWIEEKLLRAEISNVRMVTGDALAVFPVLFPPGMLAAVHVNFPDPWPRGRHARRRLGSTPLVNAAAQLLRVGGDLYYVSDREDRVEDTLHLLEAHPCLENVLGGGGVARELEGYPRTIHERKFRARGRTIGYLHFRRRP